VTAERVRTLLLRGDNLLKSANPERYSRALAAFEEALDVAEEPQLRELVERRIQALRALMEAQG
jgi:hypothetical protein